MNRRITAIFCLMACILTGMQAQSLKQQGTSVEDLVPEGWTHDEVTGDLNKDGIADLVVNAKRILAIYFGHADGKLTLWRQYDQVLPVDEDENCNMIQGYLFDKPLNHDEYTRKLADGHIYSIQL